MSSQHLVVVGIGTNLGDRLDLMRNALKQVQLTCGQIQKISNIYETAPIGVANQPFLNGAFLCSTNLEPSEFLHKTLNIEKLLGRTRQIKWGNRTIDLDILLWKNSSQQQCYSIIHEVDLQIPHIELLNRDFALVPASEVAGDWIIPEISESVITLAEKKGFCLQSKIISGNELYNTL